MASQAEDAGVGDRERLLEAVVDLCESAGGGRSKKAQEQLEAIFLNLVSAAEKEVRERLSSRLADVDWAPAGLIRALAFDDIAIARPVIARSPVLKDHDLIGVLAAATLEHQIEVARRPALSQAVVAAVIEAADPVVLTALAANVTADIDQPSMSRLVALSERISAIRGPLSRHPRLNLELASALYAWVGRALRKQITERFSVDEAAIEAAVRAAVHESLSPEGPQPARTEALAAPPPPASELLPEDPDVRLIAKLQAAGELKPGFLLRALRQGKLDLFLLALSCLANTPVEEVKAAVNARRPEGLALLCGIVGIDRSVFPTILSFVRALNDSRPAGGPEALAAASAAVAGKSRTELIVGFKSILGRSA
jgi:uncharacterized protein (DUF2336 family)